MIVPVSSEKYKNLFSEAAIFLFGEDSGKTIDSLNEYYGYMRTFYEKAKQDRKAYKYIMMPLDQVGEEAFKIDLNTRTINVPAAFSKVGSVQADQMAELIVFNVDRYFDYMDLANTLIYVQWQLPDANHTTGATAITIKDLESDPGKMRFAWPLHGKITEHSGIVKFSVRFFLYGSDSEGNPQDLIYSLNTLDANLIVKPALDTASVINPEPWSDLFNQAIINSQYTQDGKIPPEYPLFDAPGMDLTIMNKDDFVRLLSEAVEAKKTQVAKLGDDDKLTLQAQAVTVDSGSLSYKWKFKPDTGELASWTDVDSSWITTVTKPAVLPVNPVTKEHELDFKERYYLSDGVTPYTADKVPTGSDGKYDNSLYENYTQLEIPVYQAGAADVVGTYAVVAVNEVSDMTKELWSTYCYLPGPADIEFKDPIFTLVNDADGKPSDIKVNLKEDINSPSISYLWFRNTLSKDDAITAADGTAITSDSAVDISTLTPGWYSARVIANLNRKNKIKGTPEAQVIYAEPIIEKIVPSGGEGETAFNIPAYATQKLQVNVIVPLPAGFTSEDDIADELYRNLSYEWQYTRVDSNSWKNITSTMIGDTNDKLIAAIDNTEGSITVRNIEDSNAYRYRCIVKNTLGKKSVSKTLDDEQTFLVY